MHHLYLIRNTTLNGSRALNSRLIQCLNTFIFKLLFKSETLWQVWCIYHECLCL